MPTRFEGGRARTERTFDEEVQALKKQWSSFSETEKSFLLRVIRGERDAERVFEMLLESHYERVPVGIDEFLDNEYYSGPGGSSVYEKIRQDFREVFQGRYSELIMTGGIGWGKSLAGDTEVYDATNNRRRRIDEPVEYETLTLADRRDLETRPSRPRPTGRKRCARVTLASGTTFTASWDHRVLTNHGWCDVGSLLEGRTVVATPREIPEPDDPRDLPDAEVKLLGMLIGDGCMVRSGSPTFTNQDPTILNEYVRCALEVTPEDDPSTYSREKPTSENTFDVRIGGLTDWARRWGIHGVRSVDKRVPAELYGLSDEQVAMFLRWLWACDGSVYTGSPRKIEFQVGSEDLAKDVRWMLKRLGVHSRKVARESSCGEFESWRVAVTGVGPMERFLETVGPIPGKRRECADLLEHCRSTDGNANDDDVPFDWYDFRQEMFEKGDPVPKKWKRAKGQSMTRQGFEAYVEETGYDGRHARHAESDVYWDRVVDVEPVGERVVYDMSVEDTRNFIGDGVVLHNSYGAAYAIMYSIYRLTCLRDPQETFNLAPGSDIYFVLMSVTGQQAKLSLYSDLQTKIEASQYFDDIGAKCLTDKAEFPKNIYLLPTATTSRNVLSLNVFGGIVDEANFGQNRKRVKNSINASGAPPTKVEKNYKKVLTRMKSRFMVKGALPGVLILVSSKNTEADFTAKRIANTKDDPTTYVMDYAEWETKPDKKYSGETFRVFFGGRTARSRILEEGEDPPAVDDENARVLEIPVEFRSDFEDNLVESIRDIAGVEVPEVMPFIHKTDAIPAMSKDRPDDPPLRLRPPYEWTCGSGTPFDWDRLCEQADDEVVQGYVEQTWRPKVHPDEARHIHIDPSLSDDATGFAMGHVERMVDVVMRDSETGEKYKESHPLVYIDLAFRIVAPEDGEIRYRHVRRLVYELSRHGFHIPYVSMDSYQSSDTLQLLEEQGYETEVRSLDSSMDGYSTLKSAMYQERVRCYEYEALEHELRRLRRLDQEDKVDHPQGESKDIADALAGVVWSLEERDTGLMDIPDPPNPQGAPHPSEDWQTPSSGPFNNDGGGGTVNPFD